MRPGRVIQSQDKKETSNEFESSYERTEQERPRSATAAGTDHSPDVQGNNGGEQLPANVTPAPASPDPDDLVALLLSWIRTPDGSTSQTYLQAHSELLTEAAAQTLAMLTQHQADQRAYDLLRLHQRLLHAARKFGVEVAYQEEEELQALVITWLQISNWETSQTYLQAHPRLLTDAAAQMLEEVKRAQREEEVQAMISTHQALLQEARVKGIWSAYKRLLAFELGGTISDQEQAFQRAAALNDAGITAIRQYQTSGQVADLNQAVEFWHRALNLTPFDSPDRPGHLNNLGNGLSDRYARTGELADLEAAISASQQAVQATPPNSPGRHGYLDNLGNGLSDRYARTGELADLEAAITAYQQAVQTTPPDSPDWPRYLNNLGAGLSDRYARSGELADLEAAISVSQQAVQATPPDSPDWPRYLNNLGAGLSDRYARSGELADLEAAISVSQQAVHASPADSPIRPALLNNLGAGLRDRYARTEELADLEAAISAFQQTVQATPPDSPDRPGRLNNLGVGLRDRYTRTGELTDLEAAITAWERGWSIPYPHFAALPVTYQLGQQRQGAGIAVRLVTAYLERARQHLPRAPSMPHRALEIAEGSKSRLLTQLVGRGPLPRPLGLSQEIAAREQQLLAELTALDTQELTIHDHFSLAQEETGHLQRLKQRQAILRELEDLWTRIARVAPEGTLYVALRRGAAPTWQEVAGLTKALGPATALLSFFTTTDRALLFLLRAGWRSPRVIEVPLSQTGWADLLERFFREVHRYSPGIRRSETWDQPLRPLFARAQHHLEGVERLILAPAGKGHLLPWAVLAERAGWQTSTGKPLPLLTLPALGILPRLRQQQRVPPGPALVIGNPRGDLPYAEVEANAVAERFGTKPLLGAAATKSAMLTRLAEATLIHLATHARFDANNPLESGIVLADGVLTAREVLQHRLQADLLVLSACESGVVGSLGGEELAGLSQAFLQAGVRSLLVSLWQVNDLATAALMPTKCATSC